LGLPSRQAEKLVNVLRDEQAIESDHLIAKDMAGDFTVVNDELVEALLAILRNGEESKQVRARAAISLRPILEYADTEGLTMQVMSRFRNDLPTDSGVASPALQGRALSQGSPTANPSGIRACPGGDTRMPSVPLTRVAMICGNLPRLLHALRPRVR